ncbi:LLM class flavin-dependent oxidoreductase [Streptosporangium sp. G11]|uniref:LLM class flavin-dependent oxidoreductase n=1 Tax=Streptosporangium sp. G11 TaxID=3436926 RepID=UPI003EC0D408
MERNPSWLCHCCAVRRQHRPRLAGPRRTPAPGPSRREPRPGPHHHPGPPLPGRLPRPRTLLTYLAARTDRITFVPTVASLPLRPPAILVKSAAGLHLLTGGRLHPDPAPRPG